WVAIFDGAGIPSGSINRVSEALTSPQTVARDMVLEMEHPAAGTFRTLGLPIEMSATPPSVRLLPPTLGSDNDAVLGELGFSAEEIAGLRAAGVV
ncbi:MAG TPA: CoA transferase, partial [Acidimicrobiia bacterium]|nr:CoA transferase [Acidimicrobiia bacterium]